VGITAVAEAIAQVLANGLREVQVEVEKSEPQAIIRKKVKSLTGKDGSTDKKKWRRSR
jgi:hypothetical protein